MDDTVLTSSATELAALVRAKEVSSRELLDGYLDRIDRLGGEVNAVVTVRVDEARAAADAADDATARGDDVGPLHGLPVTIKDAIATAGIRSTGGAVELQDHVPTVDAPVVARLRQAGAVVFGKTNLPRWSGDVQTYNELFGTTSNPWDLTRVPGGSSGGAAAAVACGFTSFEIGTDIGGSVRTPSHLCGVFGLKPSFGVVPQRGYLDHVGGGTIDVDINVLGPIARSADDLSLLLSVVAGPPPELAPAWTLALPDPGERTLEGRHLAVWFDEPACPIVASGYGARLDEVASTLSDAGAIVEEAHPPVDFADQVALFFTLITGAVSPAMADDIGDVMSGSHLQWLRAAIRRSAVQATWAEWFERFDALLCPVTLGPAFVHDQEGDIFSRTVDVDGASRPYVDNISWAGLVGIVGLPSAVPPIGSVDGLPVGVQVVTPYLHDRRAVQLAGLVADACSGGYRVPPGF